MFRFSQDGVGEGPLETQAGLETTDDVEDGEDGEVEK
jgi:hypothetical protein